MGYLLALDQGTTSSRALVFDTDGRLITVAQREFTQHYPQPGWVEHDPEEIWQTQIATARAALDQAGIHADAVLALGITNQRETTLLWERASGRPAPPRGRAPARVPRPRRGGRRSRPGRPPSSAATRRSRRAA